MPAWRLLPCWPVVSLLLAPVSLVIEPGVTHVHFVAAANQGGVHPGYSERATALLPIGLGHYLLVIEDKIEVGQFATRILEDLGYRTIWATKTEEALDRLSEDGAGFDVVFSDVVMPSMGGRAYLVLQRRKPALPLVLGLGYSHVLVQDGDHGFELPNVLHPAEQLGHLRSRILAPRSRKSPD